MSYNYNQNFQTDYAQPFGGFNPSQMEYILRQSRMQDQAAFQQQLLRSDPRAQFAAAMWENNMGALGNQGRNTARLIAGSAINSRQLSPLFGGSRVDMYSGIATGLGNAGLMGMRMVGDGPTRTESFHGPGSLTSLTARSMLGVMESNMYNPLGGARTHRTGGLDRSELGAVAGHMLSNGMYGEVGNVGTIHKYKTRAEAKAARTKFKGSGDTDSVRQIDAMLQEHTGKDGEALDFEMPQRLMTIDDGMKEKFRAATEQGAKVVGQIKDILGDIGSSALIAQLESLTGGAGGAQSLRMAEQRLQKVGAMAAAGGGSQQAYLAEHGRVAGLYQSMGMSSFSAAAASMDTMGAMSSKRLLNQKYVQTMADQGVYVEDRSEDAITESVMNVAAMHDENPELATMLYAAQTSSKLTGEQRAALEKKIQGATNAGAGLTGAERRQAVGKAMAGAASEVERQTGRSLRDWNDRAGGDALGQLQPGGASIMFNMSQKEMGNRSWDLLSKDLYNEMGANVSKTGVAVAKKYSKATIAKHAATGEDWEGMTSAQLTYLADTLNGKDYSELVSEEGQTEALKKEIEERHGAMTLGDTPRGQNSIIEGILGGETISDAMVGESLRNKNNRGKTQETMGWDDKKRKAFIDKHEAGGGAVLMDKDGNYVVYNAEEMEAGRKGLERESSAAIQKKLLGSEHVFDETLSPEALGTKFKARTTEVFALEGEARVTALNEMTEGIKAGDVDPGVFLAQLETEIATGQEAADKIKPKKAVEKKTQQDYVDKLKGLRDELQTTQPFDPQTWAVKIFAVLDSIMNKL